MVLQRGSQHWALAVGLIGSFVAIGLHSIVDFNLYIPANALALAWLAGTTPLIVLITFPATRYIDTAALLIAAPPLLLAVALAEGLRTAVR